MLSNPCRLALALVPVLLYGAVTSDRRQSFNDRWRFSKGDAAGAEAPDFKDSGWRSLRLPHDWAIEGPFDSKLNPSTGALPISGVAWYRKTFTVPDSLKGERVSLEF